MKKYVQIVSVIIACMSYFTNSSAFAENGKPIELPEVLVIGKSLQNNDSMNDVVGTKVFAGKKLRSTVLSEKPTVQNNNYREAFSNLPGLLVSEQSNHAHVNINHRGIGDPHESQDLLTLKDGLPIGMERYGYSTTYYTPPLEAVERIELMQGGSALMYGPQPGPALNFVTYMPPKDKKLTGSTQHIMGSNNLYGTFNSISGTSSPFGYLGYIHHSQSNGQRRNEGFDIYGGSLKLIRAANESNRWIYNLDIHKKESGEPGRLTLAQYQANPYQTLRPSDYLETKRYGSSLTLEQDLTEDTLLTTTLYGSYFDRFSLRRTSNTSNQNNLDRREVFSGGLETRLRHDYMTLNNDHTFTGGAMLYGSDAPRSQSRSTTYPSKNGTPIFDFDYRTYSGAIFFENLFRAGNFSVAPALRLEHINMRVKENFNTGKTSALHNIEKSFTVPLVGISSELALNQVNEVYGNISQGFKPPQFDTLAPTANNTLPANDLNEGKTWTYELGVRGNPTTWMQYDVSGFLTEYQNYFGSVVVGSQTQNQNVGDAQYRGAELSAETDLIGLYDRLSETQVGSKFGSLSLYGNLTLLSAEFKKGPLEGREPAYAPNYLTKAGLVWRLAQNRGKVAIIGTFVEDHYWADNNLAGSTGLSAIPAYEVWDLNSEFNVYKDNVKLFFNISNLTGRQYYSRVRSDGIEPILEKQYLGGVKLAW